MELVPAALGNALPYFAARRARLAPAVLDYYLRNAAFLAPFEPERPAGFYTAEHHARELGRRCAARGARHGACAFILR